MAFKDECRSILDWYTSFFFNILETINKPVNCLKLLWHKFWTKWITPAGKTVDSHLMLNLNPDKNEHISFTLVILVTCCAFWRNAVDCAMCFVFPIGTKFLTLFLDLDSFPQGSVGSPCKSISINLLPCCTPRFCDLEQLPLHPQLYIACSSLSLLSVISSTLGQDLPPALHSSSRKQNRLVSSLTAG